MTALETYVEKIDEDLDAACREIDRRADELGAKIKAESEKHDAAIGDVKKSVEEAATSHLATLAFGVVWLAIGVALATLAPEIVKLTAGQWCHLPKMPSAQCFSNVENPDTFAYGSSAPDCG